MNAATERFQAVLADATYGADLLPPTRRRQIYEQILAALDSHDVSTFCVGLSFDDLDFTEDEWNAVVARVRIMRGAALAED